MAKDPAMLFYTADFLIGVAFMSMEERGQYITLLCFQQQRGHLTIDEMTKAVGEVSPEVLGKFVQDEEGKYYNERAEVEITKRNNYSLSRTRNGNATKHMQSICKAYAEHMENENEIEKDNNKRENRGVGERERKTFKRPTVEEVADYCRERNNGVDPQAFCDFYESKGWLVGKTPMKDWKAAVRTWEQRHKDEKPATYRGKPLNKAAQEIKSNAPNYAAFSWEIVKEAVGGV